MFLFRGRETNLRRHSIRLGADRDEGEGSHAIYTALPSCAAPLRGGASGRPQTPMPVWVDVEPLKSPFVARLSFPKIPSGGFAPEGESGQHHMRCLPSSICLRCSSRICSNRGGSWKSRTSFFVTSSTSPSGVHRAVCGCVGATGRCWYGCHGFGQACLGRPG